MNIKNGHCTVGNSRRVTQRLLALALLGNALLPWTVNAKPNEWNVQGLHGEMHIEGAFAEGPCQVDMPSAFQEIVLPPVLNAYLRRPGDRSSPLIFTIKLRDCMASGGGQTDRYTGTQTWDARQPVVAVAFTGVTEPDSPALLKVEGVSGIGVRLTDASRRDVRIGTRSAPQFVSPGQDRLVFYAAVERTSAPLTTGVYRATADFQLDYE